MKRFLILSILIGFSMLSFGANFYVYPLAEKLSGNPGEALNFTLTLSSNFDTQVTISASTTDFFVNSKGNYDYSPDYKFSCSDWIKLPSNNVTVSPGQSISYNVTLKIPSNASGQRFAAINLEYVPPDQTGKFRVDLDTIVIVILNITNSRNLYMTKFESAKIYNTTSKNLPKNFPQSLKTYPYAMKFEYQNEGNLIVGLQGQLRIVSDTMHKIIGNVNLDRQKTIAFPDITRTVWIPIEKLMPNGDYRALISADLGDNHMTSQSFKFKVTDAKISQKPALKLDTSEIDIPLERLNSYLGKNFNVESLDYRNVEIKADITGLSQNKDGSLEPAPLDKSVFGNLKVYPSSFVVYPYSQRVSRIAGQAPDEMPSEGQHYALLRLIASVAEGKEPKIVNIPIVMTIGKTTGSLALDDLTTTSVGTETKVSVDVENTGNSYADYSGQVFVLDAQGKSVLMQPSAIDENRVYAGFTISSGAIVPIELKKGYTVIVSIKYKTGINAGGNPIYRTVSKEIKVNR